MTSKTFKSAGNPEAAISVVPSADGVRTVHVHGIEASGVTVPREDAPALALATLEAAGYTEDDTEGTTGLTHFALAMSNLRSGIEEQERITAKAEAQAVLEAEALELVNGYRTSMGDPTVASFDGFSAERVKGWLAVARRAREMRAEK